jgi:hypothetical protein
MKMEMEMEMHGINPSEETRRDPMTDACQQQAWPEIKPPSAA